jgi:tetratricopeptide (TPR) repeat protein
MPEIEELSAPHLASTLREGLVHQAAGRLAEAAECYRRAYLDDPADAEALLLLGILARQTKQFFAAVRLTALAAERRPDAAHIHLNLALARLAAGEVHLAASSCRHALLLDSRNERAWRCLGEIEAKRGDEKAARAAFPRAMQLPSGAERSALALGNLLCRQTRYEEALGVYAAGMRRVSASSDLCFAFGAAAAVLGKRREAKVAYRRALARKPNFPEVHLNFGNLLYDEGNFAAAAVSYRRAIALRPHYGKAWCNLGNALSGLCRYADAIPCYERALAIRPETVAARHNLGNALLHRRDSLRAEECFREALEMESGRAEHHNSLGNALLQQRRPAEAERCYRRALDLNPEYAAAHINLANVLLKVGQREEMKRHYRRGLELDPESAGGKYNLALAWLREGNFQEGWRLHESRWGFRELNLRRRCFAQPQWKGEALDEQTILLHAEQGLGDTLQFVRYVSLVAARGGRVVLEVQPRLRWLLDGTEGAERVIARGEPLPEFAFHCPLMSLPLAFDTGIDTAIENIPAAVPYLQVDAAAVAAAWKSWPRRGDELRVGLAWAGNPQYKSDEQRSTALETLLPLARVPGVSFFSLQFGPAAAQIERLRARFPIVDACSRHKDFAETAALAATLDLILSVDTSVAHLAGSMGLPVWILLPHLADWRWLEGREDSPWYPTARIFRQPVPGGWGLLVERVCEELQLWSEKNQEKKGHGKTGQTAGDHVDGRKAVKMTRPCDGTPYLRMP